ncbi:MAG TPA: DUF2905 family protein [Candidatus Desulfobacillus sp.]|nr:DUF2905 family protein [Candidatus Desulfobacillus sp.]
MLKWLLVVLVAVLVGGLFLPRLAGLRRGGRLPGDIRLRFKGRDWHFPFGSALLLSALATLLLRFL